MVGTLQPLPAASVPILTDEEDAPMVTLASQAA
jgi:hypothetical protein